MLHSLAQLANYCHALLTRWPDCVFMVGLVASQLDLPLTTGRRQAATPQGEHQ